MQSLLQRPLVGFGVIRPRYVLASLPVAGLARDIDDVVRGVIGVCLRIVILFQVGAVAVGTHKVPVQVGTRPVQSIPGFHVIVRVQVEPALAALLFFTAVSGDVEGLVFAVRERDKVLLKRSHTEGMGDLIVVQLAVRPVGADHERFAFFIEGRRDTVVDELGISKISQHRFLGRFLHRKVMIGAEPCPVLLLVAGDADALIACLQCEEKEDKDQSSFH